jgi:ketosteroid isomerase-like protein
MLPGVSDLRARREAVVREHMESENRHDFDATLATFAHPRYELMATGQVFDGPEAVMGYFRSSRRAFPDQRNELVSLRHVDDGVVVELDLLGTAEQTGREFRSRMCALFLFEPDGDGIVCERVYFDQASILRQAGLG